MELKGISIKKKNDNTFLSYECNIKDKFVILCQKRKVNVWLHQTMKTISCDMVHM